MKVVIKIALMALVSVMLLSCATDSSELLRTEEIDPPSAVTPSGRGIASDSIGIFVDPINGLNSNPGTMAAPLQSIQWATDRANAQGKSVFLASGDYSESVFVKSNIYCGFDPANSWAYDPDNRSTIYATRWFALNVPVDVMNAAFIEDCTIVGGDSSNTYSAGVVVRGKASLRRNKIYGGSGSGVTWGVIAGGNIACTLDAFSNVIYSGNPTSGNATAMVNRACSVDVVNNTLIAHGTSNASMGFNSWPNATNSLLINNIIVAGEDATENWGVAIVTGSSVRLVSNMIVGSGSDPDALILTDSGSGHTKYNTEAEINDCATVGAYCDTEFTGNLTTDQPYLTLNGHQTPISPTIDAGIDPGTYSQIPGNDYNDEARPVDGLWDIGADEWNGPHDMGGVFVAPAASGGDDANPGTRTSPVASGSAALALAGDGEKAIYFATGNMFTADMNVDGVTAFLFGGFNTGSTWSRSAGYRGSTLLTGTSGYHTVYVYNGGQVVIEGMGIDGWGFNLAIYSAVRIGAGSTALIRNSEIVPRSSGYYLYGVYNQGMAILSENIIGGDVGGATSSDLCVAVYSSGTLVATGNLITGCTSSTGAGPNYGVYTEIGGDHTLVNNTILGGGGVGPSSVSIYHGGGTLNLTNNILDCGDNAGLCTQLQVNGIVSAYLNMFHSPYSDYYAQYWESAAWQPIYTPTVFNACGWTNCADAIGNLGPQDFGLSPTVFTDRAGGDYHLPSDSDMIDIGADVSSYLIEDFMFLDFDQETRPYNTNWDIGGDEYMP